MKRLFKTQEACLAIQPNAFAESGLESTVVLPVTTRITVADAFPLRVRMPKGTCGLARDSDLLIDQMLAMGQLAFQKRAWRSS